MKTYAWFHTWFPATQLGIGMLISVSGNAQYVAPSSGLPSAGTNPPAIIEPMTGVPINGFTNQSWPQGSRVIEAGKAAAEINSLTIAGSYDEALKQCLAYYSKYQRTLDLNLVLPVWVQLGRQSPPANAALIQIRDQDVRAFAAGQGSPALFNEVQTINADLQQSDGTYELFQSFRDKDPALAQACYDAAQGLLVARGDYQWCYSHLRDPQTQFDVLTNLLATHQATEDRLKAQREQMIELNQKLGITNIPAYTPPAFIQNIAQDHFVNGTCQLIEILVATGHPAEAEAIRDQALAVLDCASLRSAVPDAEARISRQPAH
jgi:hypothetical protein